MNRKDVAIYGAIRKGVTTVEYDLETGRGAIYSNDIRDLDREYEELEHIRHEFNEDMRHG